MDSSIVKCVRNVNMVQGGREGVRVCVCVREREREREREIQAPKRREFHGLQAPDAYPSLRPHALVA